jgi:hypothetical protein
VPSGWAVRKINLDAEYFLVKAGKTTDVQSVKMMMKFDAKKYAERIF